MAPPESPSTQQTLSKDEHNWLHEWFTAITTAQDKQLKVLKSIRQE
jgi:hypothetical protein